MIFNMRAKEVLGVIESDSTDLIGSYDSTLKINSIGGVCVQGENPSPTNPQEIKKSVVSEIKTHGLQCFDISSTYFIDNNKSTENIVKTDTGVEYTVITLGTAEGVYSFARFTGEYRVSMDITLSDNNFNNVRICGAIIPLDGYVAGTKRHISVTRNLTNQPIGIYLDNNNKAVGTRVVVENIMLNKGSVELPFEPYKESVITLSQPIELFSVGDVQDTIEDGKVKRRFTSVVFYGSDDEVWRLNSNSRVYIDLGNIKKPSEDIRTNNVLCSHFLQVRKTELYDRFGTFAIEKNSGALYFKSESATSLGAWKEWLSTNNIKVVYELAEPVTEDLPLTDQLALSWLKTFHGVTYVEFDSEVQVTLNSEYATNLEGAITLQAYADNKIGKANTLVNRAEDETQNFEVRVEHGLVYLYKDDVLHGIVGANNVTTNNQTYKTMNVRAESDADFIALTNKKTNAVCYYMNINKVPFTQNNYTEPHYFGGDMRLVGNLKATGGVWSEETHIKKMGVNGGAAQAVEWVWDSALQRYVLCTVTGQ